MVDSWVHRYSHDPHLDIVDGDLGHLCHGDEVLIFVALVAVNGSRIKAVVEDALLIAPVEHVSLGAICFRPTLLLLPIILAADLLHPKMLEGADSRDSLLIEDTLGLGVAFFLPWHRHLN